MKISNQGGKSTGSVGSATPTKVESKKSGKASSTESPKGSARVDVSDRAQQMQKAKSIASDNGIDEAKVARLQKLIDEGKYKVDADAVADRMVDTALLFPD